MSDGGFELTMRASLERGSLKLDLELDTGADRIAVDGPSGAGKTTLLRILAGLEASAEGSVTVWGERWMDSGRGEHVPPWKRRVGWVPQDALLFPHASVRDNLAWAGADGSAVRRMAELLEVAGLLDRRPRNLSGGEQQRVALGRALLARPRLLLLDEPFGALDAPRRERIVRALDTHCAEHDLPVVLVTHEREAGRALCRERWSLVDGRLIAGAAAGV